MKHKFVYLLNSEDKIILNSVGKFIKDIMILYYRNQQEIIKIF